jgi:FAD binding domain
MTEVMLAGLPAPYDWAALADRLQGDVTTSADEGWDEARRAWNLAADQWPAAVVHAESPADVLATVDFARANGLRVAPQGTGHFALARGPIDDAVLLRTDRMRGIEIDAEARHARVEAGVLWQELTDAAAAHGLVGLAGSSHDVGVVGYSLGGGVSWLARRYGFAANSVRAIEVVTTDCRHVRADAQRERELFWALRGGGGGFGVVTALELDLYPVSELVAGALFWPIDRAGDVLKAWSEWVETVPDEVTSVGRLLHFPPLPQVPEHLRGGSFVLVEAAILADETEAAEVLRPLRDLGPGMDTFSTIPARALSTLHMDPPGPVPGAGDGVLLDAFSTEGIDALLEVAGPESESAWALLSVEIRHLGGALARKVPGQGAVGALDAPFGLYAVGMAPHAAAKAVVLDQVARVHAALAPWASERTFLNFTERRADGRSVYGELAHRRLREIRERYDPDRMIAVAHGV